MMRRWLLLFLVTALIGSSCTLPPLLAQPVTTATAANASPSVTLELRGHVGGPALSVAVQSDYALVGFSYELVVLDIADRTHPQWVTALPLPANDIVIDGQRAAVVGLGGFTLLDLAEPSAPAVLGRLPLSLTPSGVAMTGAYAYVVGGDLLHIIDLTDAQTPRLLARLQLPKRLEGIAIQADKAYITAY